MARKGAFGKGATVRLTPKQNESASHFTKAGVMQPIQSTPVFKGMIRSGKPARRR